MVWILQINYGKYRVKFNENEIAKEVLTKKSKVSLKQQELLFFYIKW